MRALAGASIGALAMALGACHGSKSSLAESSDALKPDTPPATPAVLRLGAEKDNLKPTEFKISIDATRSGSELTLNLKALGETIERERYDANEERFRVLEAADNTFAPPIDLLRYPVFSGTKSEWQGKVVYAGTSRRAHATVQVAQEGAEVKVGVELFFEADPGRQEIEQALDFWIRPGKGVVRRSFGGISVRYPEGEKWPP